MNNKNSFSIGEVVKAVGIIKKHALSALMFASTDSLTSHITKGIKHNSKRNKPLRISVLRGFVG